MLGDDREAREDSKGASCPTSRGAFGRKKASVLLAGMSASTAECSEVFYEEEVKFMKRTIESYEKYHSSREDERTGLFTGLSLNFEVEKVLYPGSHVHVTPSFVFPEVVYVDSYKPTAKFFASEEYLSLINTRKTYSEKPTVRFHLSDYANEFEEPEAYFDLLLSQYAGFISQACKKYLKVGGILVANNSHGDASMASLDEDYEFIGAYNRRSDTQYTIKTTDLDEYFVPKKSDIVVSKDSLLATMRGVGYTKSPTGYIFRRVS